MDLLSWVQFPPVALQIKNKTNNKAARALNGEIKTMEIKITQMDLENPQRFIAEGLGAPECAIREARVRESTGCLHDGVRAGE